ncbi:MAG: acyltransferase family protein [Alphaproteobacteria bacterium]
MQSRGNAEYRPDVDGLRAIAVLAVILFHVDERLLPGGFVGVDVFFVISGFLITGNILRESANGGFSLADFYRRRIKRISLPMLVVTGVVVAAAQLLLLPPDAVRVARSGLWSTFSLANVYFWKFLDRWRGSRSKGCAVSCRSPVGVHRLGVGS